MELLDIAVATLKQLKELKDFINGSYLFLDSESQKMIKEIDELIETLENNM